MGRNKKGFIAMQGRDSAGASTRGTYLVQRSSHLLRLANQIPTVFDCNGPSPGLTLSVHLSHLRSRQRFRINSETIVGHEMPHVNALACF